MAPHGRSHDLVGSQCVLARFGDGLGFEARVVEVDGAQAVAVVGDIDMATAGLLREAIDEVGGHDGRVVIDLAGTTFIDSSGLAVLLSAYEQFGRRPDAVVLCAAPPPIRHVLEITGLDGRVTMVADPLVPEPHTLVGPQTSAAS